MAEEKQEEKKDEANEKNSTLGILITIGVFVSILIMSFGLYEYIMHPYQVMDELKRELNSRDNISDDYRQGWLDCIAYYYHRYVEATNMTANISW
jgi:hypothetical protein